MAARLHGTDTVARRCHHRASTEFETSRIEAQGSTHHQWAGLCAGDVPGGLSPQEHRLMAEDDAAPIIDSQAAAPTGDTVGSHVIERRGRRGHPVGVHGEAEAGSYGFCSPRTGCSYEGPPLRTGAPA